MFKSKLFSVLKSMDAAELKRFKSFSLSPYHNTNKTILRFLDHVEKYFHTLEKEAEPKRFEKEFIFKKVYYNADFNEGTFAVLRSQVLSLLEEFFIIERLKCEKKTRQKFLAESYEARNVPRIYENNYLKYEKINEEEGQSKPDWLMHKLQIFLTKMNWTHYDKIGKGLPLMLQITEDLDTHYLHKKMMLESIKANFDRRLGNGVNSQFYDLTFKSKLKKYKDKNKVIDLYVRWRELMYGEDKDIISVDEFRNDFELAAPDLDLTDKDIIYYDLLNLVVGEFNKKGNYFAAIVFNTYMTGINSALINVENEVTYKTFYNIVVSGSTAKKFEELEKFITTYGERIKLKYQYTTLRLARVQILQDKGEPGCWQEIADLLVDFNHSDILFKMKGRCFQLKAFFMIAREDQSYNYFVLGKIKAFKAFLAREKKSLKRQGLNNQRFAYWLQKLTMAYINNILPTQLLNIFSKIENDKSLEIFFKEWLLELRDR